MLNQIEKPAEVKELPSVQKEQVRKPYQKPRLEELGDLRAITLGGSPGFGDFSGDINFLPPAPP